MGTAYITRRGGGGAKTIATIVVTYPSNSVCSCAGAKKLEITATKCLFTVPTLGTYTVTCTNGVETTSETVTISEVGQRVEIQLSYLVPSSYQAVDYIEGTGTQYIIALSNVAADDASPSPAQALRVMMYATGTITTSASSANPIFGINAANGGSSGYYIDATHTAGKFSAYNGAWNTPTQSASVNTKHYIDFESDANGFAFTVDDASMTVTPSSKPSARDKLWLMAYRGGSWYYGKNRIHSCAIWNNGTLVRDMYPCKRRADEVAGMWDKVSEKFFTNAGTGVFAVGGDIVE